MEDILDSRGNRLDSLAGTLVDSPDKAAEDMDMDKAAGYITMHRRRVLRQPNQLQKEEVMERMEQISRSGEAGSHFSCAAVDRQGNKLDRGSA